MLVNGCISAKDLNNIIQDTKPSIKSMENRTNLKRPSSSGDSTYGTDSEEGSSIHEGGECGDSKAVRKRANLDHLSSDEKLMRRKLKNRVAAQNARDKKRVKMEDMEGDLERLKVSTFRSKHLHSKVKTVLIKVHKIHIILPNVMFNLCIFKLMFKHFFIVSKRNEHLNTVF